MTSTLGCEQSPEAWSFGVTSCGRVNAGGRRGAEWNVVDMVGV